MTSAHCATKRRCSDRSPQSTAHRLTKSVDDRLLEAIRAAEAKARKRAWDAGARPQEIVLDIDTTLISAHSEKEEASGNYKGGFGLPPAALLPRRDRGAACQHPASGKCRLQHCRRSLLCPVARPRAATRGRPRPRVPGTGRHRRANQACRGAGIRFSVGYEVSGALREAILASLGPMAMRSTPRAKGARAPTSQS